MKQTSLKRRSFLLTIAGVLLLFFLTACAGVTGLPRTRNVDLQKTYAYVQVLPNDELFPDCNFDNCAVLFTEGGAGLFMPRVESRGPGRPADYNLTSLLAYQVSDGSVLYAAPGTVPREYRSASGAIRIEFSFPLQRDGKRGPSGFGVGF